ncbi:hypothetical protein MTO96_032841, partial [Rhipicephalus appendiculatus]
KSQCLGSKISEKTTKTIPVPAKIRRGDYCSALGLSECDKYECLVHCCNRGSRMERLIAPDGLQCDEDPLHFYDKRCVTGACVQIR